MLEINLPFVYLTKSLIFDLTTILLPRHLILLYCLIAKVMHYQNLFTKLKLSNFFQVMSSFICVASSNSKSSSVCSSGRKSELGVFDFG